MAIIKDFKCGGAPPATRPVKAIAQNFRLGTGKCELGYNYYTLSE
jgi:hypothetical protein